MTMQIQPLLAAPYTIKHYRRVIQLTSPRCFLFITLKNSPLRPLLVPKSDWHDEIHPNSRGFKKLANAPNGINAILKRVLTG